MNCCYDWIVFESRHQISKITGEQGLGKKVLTSRKVHPLTIFYAGWLDKVHPLTIFYDGWLRKQGATIEWLLKWRKSLNVQMSRCFFKKCLESKELIKTITLIFKKQSYHYDDVCSAVCGTALKKGPLLHLPYPNESLLWKRVRCFIFLSKWVKNKKNQTSHSARQECKVHAIHAPRKESCRVHPNLCTEARVNDTQELLKVFYNERSRQRILSNKSNGWK